MNSLKLIKKDMSSCRVTLSSQEEGMSSDRYFIIRLDAHDEADKWVSRFKEVSEIEDISNTTAILYILHDIMMQHNGIEELIINNNLKGVTQIENIEYEGDGARIWAGKFCKRIIHSQTIRKKLKSYLNITALYNASRADEKTIQVENITNFLKHFPFVSNGKTVPNVSQDIYLKIADTLGALKLIRGMGLEEYAKLASVRFFPKIAANTISDFTLRWDPEKFKPMTPEFHQYCDTMFNKIYRNHRPSKGENNLKRKRDYSNGKGKKPRFNKKKQQGSKPNNLNLAKIFP